MKKRLILLLTTLLLLFGLGGCGSKAKTYDHPLTHASTDNYNYKGRGYFTQIAEWGTSNDKYCIVYANDTKIKYLIINIGHGYGITPLYNADGSLQLYEGE